MSDLSLPSILIIDDSPEDRERVVRYLRDGAEGGDPPVAEAEAGEEALAAAAGRAFDCILLDHHLPDMNSLEVLDRLRASGRPGPAVIVVTGDGGEALAVEAIRRGAQDYLPKRGLTALKLRSAVRGAVESVAMQARLDRQREELQSLYAAERRRRGQLEQAVKERDRFLAVLSHELRNPLYAIRTGASLLRVTDSVDGDAAEALDIIERQSALMTRLLDDLLEVSRVTFNTVTLRTEPVDLRDAARDAVEAVRARADEGGVAVEVDLPVGPVVVTGDAARLVQVQTNLLTNAVKFSDPGGRVGLAVSAEGGRARVSVCDEGVGIDPAKLPDIFEMFVSLDDAHGRSDTGLGVGLPLVRSLVELHGGEVRAFSEGLGEGSRFDVWLPLAEAAVEPPKPPADPAAAPSLSVIIVEDREDNRWMLASLLKAKGHRVREAADGEAGLRLFDEEWPDVAVIDIGLPGMSGYEVARAVRGHRAVRGVWLVALTGYGQPEDIRRAESAGFDRHITKPIDPADIDTVLLPRSR